MSKECVRLGEDSPSWYNLEKEGMYVSRLCAAANNTILSVSSDSILTNILAQQKIYGHKKFFYTKGLIICMLGTYDFQTDRGCINFEDIIKEQLKIYDGKNIFAIINNIKKEIYHYYSIVKHTSNTQIILLWTRNQIFYCYPFEIRFDIDNNWNHLPTINEPFGEIKETNMQKYKFNCHYLDCGEGVRGISVLEFNNQNTIEYTKRVVQNAVDDNALTTVGGDIYSVSMDTFGNVMPL